MMIPLKDEFCCSTFFDLIDDLDDSEIETIETLNGLVDEIKNHPDVCVKILERKIECVKENLVEQAVCPVCGAPLEFERNGYNNYVPCGSTSVCESEGYDMICPSCGWRGL